MASSLACCAALRERVVGAVVGDGETRGLERRKVSYSGFQQADFVPQLSVSINTKLSTDGLSRAPLLP